ncbi:unnamed protein product [Symbiodinium sp. CCMP2592]|nr:unnamed protein product [Symbiodinium sp. CCMP2592]
MARQRVTERARGRVQNVPKSGQDVESRWNFDAVACRTGVWPVPVPGSASPAYAPFAGGVPELTNFEQDGLPEIIAPPPSDMIGKGQKTTLTRAHKSRFAKEGQLALLSSALLNLDARSTESPSKGWDTGA